MNRELDRLEAKRGLDVDLMVFKQLLTTMQVRGEGRRRGGVERDQRGEGGAGEGVRAGR